MRLRTLAEGLEAVRREDRRIFFIDGSDRRKSITFDELYKRALGLLTRFRQRGLKAGDELIISTSNNLAFIDAFWACQFGGIVPIPVAPGITLDQRKKLLLVYRQLDNAFLYIDHSTGGRIRALADSLQIGAEYQLLKSKTILIENITDLSEPAAPVHPGAGDISYIQFSSGSTSDPKGVVLTHNNLCTNICDIHAATKLSGDDISLSWMPLTHDMGLIGFHLAMVLRGVTHHIMATDMFVRRPLSWLQTASEQKATLLCSPNFGYRLFLKAFARWSIEGLDLSSVRLVFNGAEPISARLCDEFLTTLAPYGLRRTAMAPVYGLAEASLAVSFPPLNENYKTIRVQRNTVGLDDRVIASTDSNAIEFVGVGQPVAHCEVRITDSMGNEAPAGQIGRIEINGPNVTQGYYSAGGVARDALNNDNWLDTGDLGFRKDDTLYITGRLKDVLFVHGQNFYAHDLENVVSEAANIDQGKVVVCAVNDDTADGESIAVFVLYFGETEKFAETAARVRRAFGEHAGVEISSVVPVDEIPKTTSGKLRRHVLRQAYEKGRYDEVLMTLGKVRKAPEATLLSDMEKKLLSICGPCLGDIRLERNDNFFEIGMNSLKLVEIHELIDQHFPSQLEISDMFDHPTLAQLASFLQTRVGD